MTHLHGRVGDQLATLPPTSKEWLEFAVQISQELDPSSRRVSILKDGPEAPGWYGLFGQPIVA